MGLPHPSRVLCGRVGSHATGPTRAHPPRTGQRYDLQVKMTARKCRILVVDDEEPIVEIIESMIARFGHETLHAYSGQEAVALARDARPDALVTGIMMAGGDGVWTAQQFRQLLPSCKIVFVSTALYDAKLRQVLVAEGYDERIMLTKPFEAAQLANALTIAGI